jgi:hypothetical protein
VPSSAIQCEQYAKMSDDRSLAVGVPLQECGVVGGSVLLECTAADQDSCSPSLRDENTDATEQAASPVSSADCQTTDNALGTSMTHHRTRITNRIAMQEAAEEESQLLKALATIARSQQHLQTVAPIARRLSMHSVRR